MLHLFAKKPPPTAVHKPSQTLRAGSTVIPARDTAGQTKSSNVQAQAQRISADNILSIAFSESLFKELKINPSWVGEVALHSTGMVSQKQIILFAIDAFYQHGKGEQFVQLLSNIRLKGYELTKVYLASRDVVVGLNNGAIENEKQNKTFSDPKQAALFKEFHRAVSWAYTNEASDLDFRVCLAQDTSQILFNIGGKMVAPAQFNLPTSLMMGMLSNAYQNGKGGNGGSFDPGIEQQCVIPMTINGLHKVRLRWSSLAADLGPCVTLRLQRVGQSALTVGLDQLGYLPSQIELLENAINASGGAIVFSGVVGSGKSRSLSELASYIPSTAKLVTIEDPVEYEIPGAVQNTVTRGLTDDKSLPDPFIPKARSLLRQAIHAALIGEIRDPSTGEIAATVMQSGHTLLTTTHAASAIGIVDRFASKDIGMSREVLSTPGMLRLLVNQKLLTTSCPGCKLNYNAFIDAQHQAGQGVTTQHYLDRFHRLFNIPKEQLFFRNTLGCSTCKQADLPELFGYGSRTVVAEVLEVDEQMLLYFRDAKNVELETYVRSKISATDPCSPDMSGKDTLACAIYKVSIGLIDLREIEPHFMSYKTMETKRTQRGLHV